MSGFMNECHRLAVSLVRVDLTPTYHPFTEE
jgi:hypothetical protein